MKYYENVLGLVGHTPLVRLNRMTQGIKALVLAKMENLNPGGSVKDRIGRAIVAAAESDGTLKPGGTIVEATSGNTGIGLALAAAVKGYRCIFVMTDKSSTEKVRYLKALGADVVVVPASAKPGTPDHYVATAKRIASETPNSFYPNQYSHPANPEAHYLTTGTLGTDRRPHHALRRRTRHGRDDLRRGPLSQREERGDQSHRRRPIRVGLQDLQGDGQDP
jgi:cystathionine beta-synthase